jgi:hypothetical protein
MYGMKQYFFFIFDWDIAIFKNLGLLEIIVHEKKNYKVETV